MDKDTEETAKDLLDGGGEGLGKRDVGLRREERLVIDQALNPIHQLVNVLCGEGARRCECVCVSVCVDRTK